MDGDFMGYPNHQSVFHNSILNRFLNHLLSSPMPKSPGLPTPASNATSPAWAPWWLDFIGSLQRFWCEISKLRLKKDWQRLVVEPTPVKNMSSSMGRMTAHIVWKVKKQIQTIPGLGGSQILPSASFNLFRDHQLRPRLGPSYGCLKMTPSTGSSSVLPYIGGIIVILFVHTSKIITIWLSNIAMENPS